MPNNIEKKDFATAGTEAFNMEGLNTEDDKVVLSIDEEDDAPIIKHEQFAVKSVETGNVVVDTFNSINLWLIRHSKIKVKSKATFFHLLSVMLNAGLPMVISLNSLASQSKDSPKLKMIIDEVALRIEAGEMFSSALANYPSVFEDQEIGMIRAGEVSGQLSKVMENISIDLDKAHHIKSKIKSAMMYPSVVFTLLIGIVSAMMIFVIPQLADIFAQNGANLPLVTKIVMALSDFMVTKKKMLVAGIVGFFVSFYLFRKTAFGHYQWDRFKLHIPIFGPLLQKAYVSRLARSLSALIDSSISIVKAVEITASSMGNDVYKRRLMMSMEDLKQGIPLGESMSDNPLFPPMLVNMIKVGEQTAQLDTITAKIADFYEEEVDTAVDGISKIIEPIILIGIGLSVGTVVAAVMLPIFQLSDIASNV